MQPSESVPTSADSARFAESEEELRDVFARSKYRDIAASLSFAKYFPRSQQRALAENRNFAVAGRITAALWGVFVGVIIYTIASRSLAALAIFSIAALPLIRGLKRLARRLFDVTSESSKFVELVCFDRRRPVIYLRRFATEDPPLPTGRTRHALLDFLTRRNRTQAMENFADLLALCGPVVGVGRPDEPAILHRIHRLFVLDESWRAVVARLVNDAALIFIHYESSHALDWELGQAVSSNGNLFVYIPGVSRETALDGDRAREHVPAALRNKVAAFEHVARASEGFASNEHALLVSIVGGAGRIYGLKHHWDDLWRALFKEIVRHKLSVERDTSDVPAAYATFVQAMDGSSSTWPEIALFAIGAAASLLTLFNVA